DDTTAYLNKATAFLTTVSALRFLTTNNQLRAFSNPGTRPLSKTTGLLCNKFKGGKDKIMLVMEIRVMLIDLGEAMQAGKQGFLNVKIVKVKDIWLGNALSTWYKYKAMLAEARETGHILDEEKLTFLADTRVLDAQAVQTIIPNNAAFQTEDLDTYDSDCDDILNAKVVLMANISNYGSDIISDVPHSKTYLNDIEDESVHAM
nr:hypothetical protein [Tanacetum cinerariifolium]